jgi:hypothetical protein
MQPALHGDEAASSNQVLGVVDEIARGVACTSDHLGNLLGNLCCVNLV